MTRISHMLGTVVAAAQEISKRLELPSHLDAVKSLAARVPEEGHPASGLDAGLASALGIVDERYHRFLMQMHFFPTPALIAKIRCEVLEMALYSETTMWLALSSLCMDGKELVDVEGFRLQIEKAKQLVADDDLRIKAAREEFESMKTRYQLLDGIPFGVKDAGIYAAYMHGYSWGVEYAETYGIFFVSTLDPTLGVFERGFKFSDRVDAKGNTLSGKLKSGTLQRCKCSSFEELAAVIRMVRENLGPPLPGVCPKCSAQMVDPWACHACGISF